jgi:segregation and condensation protein B
MMEGDPGEEDHDSAASPNSARSPADDTSPNRALPETADGASGTPRADTPGADTPGADTPGDSGTEFSRADKACLFASGSDTREVGGAPEGGSGERAAIEAVLVVAIEPVTPGLLAELLEVSVERVEELCASLAASYETDERGFELVRVAGGYRLQSHPAYRGYVERFLLEGVSHRLSNPALETLAIVAYKQPISRSQIAAIRGVNADGVLRLLVQRGYLAEVGRDDGPGQAVLFGTTSTFLQRLGLDSVEDLPALSEFVPDAETVERLEQVLRPGGLR